MNSETLATADTPAAPRWRPLEAVQRRALGVLIEKAKTTPESYPLSLNALRTGCNQKSNRSPLMQLEEPQVDEALEGLRMLGAVAQVQGSGRVDRYRHLAYEWLGVDKVELAVMAELLLRGSQAVGELRGRAARMEPIKDIGELTPILDSLKAKGLVVYLTPPGRGSIVTHALYLDREMEKVRREAGAHPVEPVKPREAPEPVAPVETVKPVEKAEMMEPVETGGSPVATQPRDPPATASLVEQLDDLRDELAAVRREFESVRSELAATADGLRRDLEELNRQLGN